MPIAQFVRSIQSSAGRIMIDRTGLEGDYEFTFRYSTPRPGGGPPDPDAAPDLFTALSEQLGLKVEPTRTTSEFLIVEHIEKFVCPTVTSDQLLGGAPFRFRGAPDG